MNIRLSVVIPCYNREKTIKRCIESVLHQTKLPDEIIIVDDGSSDKTVEIVKEFACSKMKILQQNHRGAQAARNLGVLNATGDYIAFLDSDDEWKENTVELFFTCVTNGNEGKVIYGNYIIRYERKRKNEIVRVIDANGWVDKILLKTSIALFGCTFAPRKDLLEMGLLDEKVQAYQEWDTAIRLSRKCEFKHVKYPFLIYYKHEDDCISKNHKASIKGYNYIIKKNRKEIVKYWGYPILKEHYNSIIHECMKMNTIEGMLYYIFYAWQYLFCSIHELLPKRKE